MNSGSLFQGLNSALPKNPRKVNNPFGTASYITAVVFILPVVSATASVDIMLLMLFIAFSMERDTIKAFRVGGEGGNEKTIFVHDDYWSFFILFYFSLLDF